MNPRFLVSITGLVLAVSAAAGCGGSVDSRPAKWSYIAPVIIEPNCATANCHSALSQRMGVRLDTIDRSFLQARTWNGFLTLLRGQMGTVQRMPPDFPLSDPDIALIQEWVDDGKAWDGPGSDPSSK